MGYCWRHVEMMAEAELLPASDPANVLRVARLLRDGGVAVIPTDTVYGLACSIYQRGAVERIYRIKGRAPEKQVPVLLATAADLPLLVQKIPRPVWGLITRFWPGPLTLVLPAAASAPDWVVSHEGKIAVRVPGGRSCLELLQAIGEPLVGTSANISGNPPSTSAVEAVRELGDLVDAVLSDDSVPVVGVSSTVVEVSAGGAIVHREGVVTASHVRETLGMRVDVFR